MGVKDVEGGRLMIDACVNEICLFISHIENGNYPRTGSLRVRP